MKLLDLMFCEPITDHSEILSEMTAYLADPLDWDELSEQQKADLFGKLIGTRQSIDHCLRVQFGIDAEDLPKKLDDVAGASELSPWNCRSAKPVVEDSFIEIVGDIVRNAKA